MTTRTWPSNSTHYPTARISRVAGLEIDGVSVIPADVISRNVSITPAVRRGGEVSKLTIELFVSNVELSDGVVNTLPEKDSRTTAQLADAVEDM